MASASPAVEPNDGGPDPTAGLLPVAAASASTGLPSDLQGRFEESLGVRLDGVRVHTDGASADAADALGARAFAMGNDVHFGAGQYQPNDPFGQHLIAHEVAHTVQQSRASAAPQAKSLTSSPGDAAEIEADHAANAMVSGRSFAISAAPSAAIHRSPPDAKPVPAALDLDAELALPEPDYSKVFGALNNLNMLDMVKRIDKLRAHVSKLLTNLKSDGFAGTSRIRAAVLAVQLKGTDTSTTDGAAKLKHVIDELAAAKVEIYERADIAQYLEGSAGKLRTATLDELAARIDAAIVTIKDVELLTPSKQHGSTEEADRAKVAALREKTLRDVHDYMRIVDAEIVVLADPALTKRKDEKKRFDRFKMMREAEALADKLQKVDGAEYEETKKRKYELDKLLQADGGDRKPVGTSGVHAGKTYVVYEDCVKWDGDLAWINNNPGNMTQSPLATNFKNATFSIFTTMELGFAAIPLQLKQWRAASPTYYTLLNVYKQWANRPGDNPVVYAQTVADGLNAKGIKAKGAKITTSTLIADLDESALVYAGEVMGQKVESMRPGTIFYRSHMTSEPWLKPLLGPPYP
jgi:hypothetical protein